MMMRFFMLPCLLGFLGGSVLGGYAAWHSGSRAEDGPAAGEGEPHAVRALRQMRAPRMQINKIEAAWGGDSLEYFRAIPLSRFPAEMERLVKENREKTLQTLFEVWASRDPDAARAHWESLPFRKRREAAASLCRGWMIADADGALAYLAENRKTRGELRDACRAVLPLLVEDCPEKALPWLRSFGGSVRQSQMNAYFELCLHRSIEEAEQFQEQLSDRERRLLCSSEEIAFRWGKKNWNEALKWINAQPEDQRQVLRQEAIVGLGLSDPDQMKKELLTLPDGEERDKFLSYLASSRWNGEETKPCLKLEDILKMQNMFQKPEHARIVIGQAAESLAESNPEQLLSLARSGSSGDERNLLIAKYAEKNDRLPIAQRLAVLDNLNDSAAQRGAASNLLIEWNDAQKAVEWVDKSSASPELKQRWKTLLRDTPSRIRLNFD